jgi:hypothetical protein
MILGQLQDTTLPGLFAIGLNRFLEQFLRDNANLGGLIAEQYLG